MALSAYVHGYSGKQELAKTVNVFYLQMVALRASVYFVYVPSKANNHSGPPLQGGTRAHTKRALWPPPEGERPGHASYPVHRTVDGTARFMGGAARIPAPHVLRVRR